ncbi:hypothetical protein Tco_0212640 [Tanacetum coccineum]
MTTSKLPSLIGIRSISKGGIFSIEARDMDTKLLSAPKLNNTLARFLGQMAHLVASITLNSARSCMMHNAFLTQGTVSNITIIFSWSDSIRPEGFLSSVLLWLVIIVTVVGVDVMAVVVIEKLLQIKEMADQDTPPPTITAMKIPIIKKGEYDIWSMRTRQYICHTDHNLWDLIVNGDVEDEATPSGEQSSPPVPKTTKQLGARRNQERIKSILLLEIPDEYLLKFHSVPDAKSL